MLSDCNLETIIVETTNEFTDTQYLISEAQQIEKTSQNLIIEEKDQQTLINEQGFLIEDLKKENEDLKRRMNEFNDHGTQIIYQLKQVFQYISHELLNLQQQLTGAMEEKESVEQLIKTLESQKQELQGELDEQNLFITQCHDILIHELQSSLNCSENISPKEMISQKKQTINRMLILFCNKFTQYNENELIQFQKLIEQQLSTYRYQSINESTQVITPRSLNIVTQTQSNNEIGTTQAQLIEKNQIIEMLQNQLSQAEQTIENLKFKQTEQKLLSIIVTDRQQECQNKLEQQFQKIMQETSAKEKIKILEQENLALKLKLEALQEVIKENVRLKKNMQFNTEQPESVNNSPIRYSPINKKLIQKNFETSTRKSTEKKSIMNSDFFVKQSFLSQKTKILDKITDFSKHEKESIKQCITLLNNLNSDLRHKQNQINSEDQTKKKSVIGFIDKVHQQINFVIKKLNN